MTVTSVPSSSYLTRYLQRHPTGDVSPAAIAFYASLDQVSTVSPGIAAAVLQELADQRGSLKLIASENYSSLATQAAMGNLLTDKYAEGFAGHRFYAGCDNVDAIESEATRLARELFGADHAYVQPHSGADANLVAFLAILSARVQTPAVAALNQKDVSKLSRDDWETVRASLRNQRLMGLDYYSGGHLTHGYRHNVSAQLFDVHPYAVDRATGLLDLDQVWRQARDVRPLILLAGYSAYPRAINFATMRQIADDVGAVFMVDMAHFAGLVAGKVFAGDFDPVRHAHVVTSTTHKTLRGPRGGLVLSTREFAEAIDKGCPTVLGGPLPHVMAAKAVAFAEAASPDFRTYAADIVANARALAEACVAEGIAVATGGTDNHLLLVDVQRSFNLTGRQAESAARAVGITLNRNSLPFDPNGPWYTSGLRLGTPALTTRGLREPEMRAIAKLLKQVLSHTTPGAGDDGSPSKARFATDSSAADSVKRDVAALLSRFPLYPELDL